MWVEVNHRFIEMTPEEYCALDAKEREVRRNAERARIERLATPQKELAKWEALRGRVDLPKTRKRRRKCRAVRAPRRSHDSQAQAFLERNPFTRSPFTRLQKFLEEQRAARLCKLEDAYFLMELERYRLRGHEVFIGVPPMRALKSFRE
jgi:hypothetical protein